MTPEALWRQSVMAEPSTPCALPDDALAAPAGATAQAPPRPAPRASARLLGKRAAGIESLPVTSLASLAGHDPRVRAVFQALTANHGLRAQQLCARWLGGPPPAQAALAHASNGVAFLRNDDAKEGGPRLVYYPEAVAWRAAGRPGGVLEAACKPQSLPCR